MSIFRVDRTIPKKNIPLASPLFRTRAGQGVDVDFITG